MMLIRKYKEKQKKAENGRRNRKAGILTPRRSRYIKKALGVTALAAGAAVAVQYFKNSETENRIERWDRAAGVYPLKYAVHHRTYSRVIESICEELSPEMRVLEIASSTGDVTRRIAPYCGPLIACDVSEAMIQQAQKRGTPPNVMWDIQDAECLTYPDGSFDAVVVVNAMNVMDDPSVVLAQAGRVLKPDGILIIPNYIRSGRHTEEAISRVKSAAGYDAVTSWTWDEYLDFITMHGWEIIKSDLIPAAEPIAFVTARRGQ